MMIRTIGHQIVIHLGLYFIVQFKIIRRHSQRFCDFAFKSIFRYVFTVKRDVAKSLQMHVLKVRFTSWFILFSNHLEDFFVLGRNGS